MSSPTTDREIIRCPTCFGKDVVPTLQRKWWDWFFRQSLRVPYVCRFCGRRFYVKDALLA